jgi:hypothetical protein
MRRARVRSSIPARPSKKASDTGTPRLAQASTPVSLHRDSVSTSVPSRSKTTASKGGGLVTTPFSPGARPLSRPYRLIS